MKTAAIQTYHHTFKNGVTATATIRVTYLLRIDIEWSRKPTPAMIPEYLAWRAMFMKDIARRTGQRILLLTF